MTNSTPPGVDPVSGLLTNPEAYFWWLIQRAPNQPADDWFEVLMSCGLPAGYPPYTVPSANGYYGLTQQIRSSGEAAGRIFLPTQAPDENGYYSHPVSPLKDASTPGHLLWEWRPLGGPPYVPVITEEATGGSGDSSGSTSPDVSALEARIAALEQAAIKDGDKVCLKSTANDQWVRVEQHNGAMASNGSSDGPWEEYTVKAHR